MKRFFPLGILCLFLITSGCKDDPEAFENRFAYEDITVSLENDNLYLVQEDVTADYTMRKYYITDGTMYPNDTIPGRIFLSTHFLALTLAVPNAETISAGSYATGGMDLIVRDRWNPNAPDARLGELLFYSGTFACFTGSESNPATINIYGGMEAGETMKVEFSGNLTRSYDAGSIKHKKGRLHFTGSVQDIRM